VCSTTVNAAVNGDVFEAFVQPVLVPGLLPGGGAVVMDNLSSHRRASTIQKIEAAGAEVEFLPPYSPDLNPIENVFSKIKDLLRSLACRTREQLWQRMQPVLDEVTSQDARNLLSALRVRYKRIRDVLEKKLRCSNPECGLIFDYVIIRLSCNTP